MKKRLWMVTILAMGLALLMAGTAGAAKFQDLTGIWTGPANSAYWNKGASEEFGFSMVNVSLEVTGQDANGLFYGTFTYGTIQEPFTGSIATNKIITAAIYAGSGAYGSFTGKLSGKTITGTYNFFSDGYIATTTVRVTK
jgi:hypothetical protein